MDYRGKKRLKGRDRAYKCKGKNTHYRTCTNSRGISIPKLETFIIAHLFRQNDFIEYIQNISTKSDKTENLKSILSEKRKLFEKLSKMQKKNVEFLLLDEFKSDELFLEKYREGKKKLINLSDYINKLESEIEENSLRKEDVLKTVSKYDVAASFQETKQIVHRLIKKITLYHRGLEKGGRFYLLIEYHGLERVFVFKTNWQAMNWKFCKGYYFEPEMDLNTYLKRNKVKKDLFKRYGVKIQDSNFSEEQQTDLDVLDYISKTLSEMGYAEEYYTLDDMVLEGYVIDDSNSDSISIEEFLSPDVKVSSSDIKKIQERKIYREPVVLDGEDLVNFD